MKRTISVALALGLVLGAVAVGPAEAGKKKKKKKVERVERVVELPYSGGHTGALVAGLGGGACFPGGGLAGSGVSDCLEMPTTPDDIFVKVEVADASGQKVQGFLSQNDNDGDGINDGYGGFCGAHADAVPLETPGGMLGISLYPGVCEDGSPSTPTSGTITFTFSNMP